MKLQYHKQQQQSSRHLSLGDRQLAAEADGDGLMQDDSPLSTNMDVFSQSEASLVDMASQYLVYSIINNYHMFNRCYMDFYFTLL